MDRHACMNVQNVVTAVMCLAILGLATWHVQRPMPRCEAWEPSRPGTVFFGEFSVPGTTRLCLR